MITAYRITKKKYAGESLSGKGGLVVGGRWHHKGVEIVYCAGHLSLAAMELFVNFGKHDKKISLVSVAIDIPKDLIEVFPMGSLPLDWRQVPPPRSTAELGTKWLREQRSAVLQVPSAMLPTEANYLINPLHPAAGSIVVQQPKPFSFDPRMWK